MANLSDWVSFLSSLTTIRLGPFIDEIVVTETLYPVKIKIPIPIPLPVNLGNIDLNPLDDLPDPPDLSKIPKTSKPTSFPIVYYRPTIEIVPDLPPFELPTFSLPDLSSLQNLTFGNISLTLPTIRFVQKSVTEPNSAIAPPEDIVIAPFSYLPPENDTELPEETDLTEQIQAAAELEKQRELAQYENEQERLRQLAIEEQNEAISNKSLVNLGYPLYEEIFKEAVKVRQFIIDTKNSLNKTPDQDRRDKETEQ